MNRAGLDLTKVAWPNAPNAKLKSLTFDILTKDEAEKLGGAKKVTAGSDVTDPALGLPNMHNQCFTCGATARKECEGHFGLIEFPFTIINPYFLKEVAQVLNKICPACKFVKAKKKSAPESVLNCKYCNNGKAKDLYPAIKFKVSSKDEFARTVVTAEISEKLTTKPASDFWDFIPSDGQLGDVASSHKRILSHAQVYHMLKDVDPRILELVLKLKNSILLENMLVTPNCHRVSEFGGHLSFDPTTRHYKRLTDFRGSANDLSTRVLERIRASKVHSEKSAPVDRGSDRSGFTDASTTSGLRFIKELLLGKRTDHAFRMVIVGDPYLHLGEIGIPYQVAKELLVSVVVNDLNFDELERETLLMLIARRDVQVRRGGQVSRLRVNEDLRCGDVLYRPVVDGDKVLINRPPSIHQHSILSLKVRVLPTSSTLSINPLICNPLCGDFDGDCLHGFVPQSVDSTAELSQLITVEKQLNNMQNGRNLLSLTYDTLTAGHLILEDGLFLNKFEMQQLLMFCSFQLPDPAIYKGKRNTCLWTGKQLLSQLMPRGFDYTFPSNGVQITNGEIVASSGGSAWLRDVEDNLFHALIKYCGEEAIAVLDAAQRVLCEWLSMRGLSVSLYDLYLASGSSTRSNLSEEVSVGLEEAEFLSEIEYLLVDGNRSLLAACAEASEKIEDFGVGKICIQRQKSAALSQASISTFRRVFSDVQNLAYNYASKQNSLMLMLKSGSKGNLQKLVQHSMCIGLQHSVNPLSFRMPQRLSSAAWKHHKQSLLTPKGSVENQGSHFSFSVVESSFLTGLNPLESLVHSVANRDGAFSGHADISGTLTRKLMFFMRDLCVGYDGTVRNPYGNQIVQFFYGPQKTCSPGSNDELSVGSAYTGNPEGGHPVGSHAACAIIEAAYSALDQPISALEPSPLLNLKKTLDCGVKRNSGNKTASIFLSKKLGKIAHASEFAALEVKDHLQGLMFEEIVSFTVIRHLEENSSPIHISAYVCHFHIPNEIFKERRLAVKSIEKALGKTWKSMKDKVRVKSKVHLPDLKISTITRCSLDVKSERDSNVCIMVSLDDKSRASASQLEVIRDMVIPSLYSTVIKGFAEFRKVSILWKDDPSSGKSSKGSSSGELYLRVEMSERCDRGKFWGILVSKCAKMNGLIDWERSFVDDIRDLTQAYGIDTAVTHFKDSLSCAVRDIGKSVLPEHISLTADTLSSTGEFIALNPKGMAQLRKATSVSSPFVQACFSSPGASFVKAGKAGTVDDLAGTIDALSWGMVPAIGTGGHFDIIFNNEGYAPAQPVNVFDRLKSQSGSLVRRTETVPQKQWGSNRRLKHLLVHGLKLNDLDIEPDDIKNNLRSLLSFDDILKIRQTLRHALNSYEINSKLIGVDCDVAMAILYFHPRAKEKIGSGIVEIKVGMHPEHENSRCFLLVRTDETTEDFSYHKCIHNALLVIAPHRAKPYELKWLSRGNITEEPNGDEVAAHPAQ